MFLKLFTIIVLIPIAYLSSKVDMFILKWADKIKNRPPTKMPQEYWDRLYDEFEGRH